MLYSCCILWILIDDSCIIISPFFPTITDWVSTVKHFDMLDDTSIKYANKRKFIAIALHHHKMSFKSHIFFCVHLSMRDELVVSVWLFVHLLVSLSVLLSLCPSVFLSKCASRNFSKVFCMDGDFEIFFLKNPRKLKKKNSQRGGWPPKPCPSVRQQMRVKTSNSQSSQQFFYFSRAWL